MFFAKKVELMVTASTVVALVCLSLSVTLSPFYSKIFRQLSQTTFRMCIHRKFKICNLTIEKSGDQYLFRNRL